ncbi:MAG: cupin, partial [Acetobacteraceae bacterium]|nr:cupin [Acetobacteraceae bacterium]
LLYRRALAADAATMEHVFFQNGWSNSWRDGIFDYHHFHSIAHEVLGIAAGRVTVAFGGPAGRVLAVAAGDVVVIPAGVGHCNQGQSSDLLVVGAYPGGASYDICRGDPADHARALAAIGRVGLPERDPVSGRDAPLRRLWSLAQG